MLERFHVAKADEIRVPEPALRRTVTDLFIACGVPPAEAAGGAAVLVMADLRGIETHGVSNMMRHYVGWFRDGTLNPAAAPTVLRETAGIAVLDGNRGLGILLGEPCMRMAMAKARTTGVGVVTMRNAGHLGAVGQFAQIAAREELVGVCMTAMSSIVLPTFGAAPRLGTNPISIAAPANRRPFFVYDAATSTIAGNKIGLARRVGANIAPGWIGEPDGTPIMDERPVPDGDSYGLGQYNLLPLGGTREQGSHKGFGLGLMVEVLTTMLAGGVPDMVEDQRPLGRHYFAAYDIAAFGEPAEFKERMDAMLEALEATQPAPGYARVVYPGLLEAECEQERRANGIPLHREVIAWFDACTADLGLASLECARG
jgi:L-2-hydroxycarboxylate dehydrogenase (NAD+)